MPIGYIVTLVLLGLLTGFALIRLRRFGHVLFVVALPASELPHFGILLLGLSTVLALSQGDLAGPSGAVLLIVAGVILVGLLELLRRALLARRVMNDMLRQHGRGPQRRRTWWLRPLLFPFPWRPRSVMRTGPIFYGTDSRQRLDVYRPRNASVPGRVLVYFHGAGTAQGATGERHARCYITWQLKAGRVSAQRIDFVRDLVSKSTWQMLEPR